MNHSAEEVNSLHICTFTYHKNSKHLSCSLGSCVFFVGRNSRTLNVQCFFLEIPRPLIDFDSGVRKQKYQNSWVVNRFHLGFSIK